MLLSFPELWARWQTGTGGEEPGSGLWTTIGMFGPALAGILCTAREEGLRGVGALLRRLIQFRVAWPWALVSVALLPTLVPSGTVTCALVAVVLVAAFGARDLSRDPRIDANGEPA